MEEYIASGKLEAYALGMLNEEERADVEEMAAQYPRINEELDAVEADARIYAEQMSKSPPQELKEKILPKLSTRGRPGSSGGALPSSTNWFWMAATIIFAFIAAIGWWQWYGSSNQMEYLQSNLKSSQLCCDSLETRMNRINHFLYALQEPDVKHIPMKATGFLENAYACVYYQPSKERVFLDSRSLPSTEADVQYQLWGIVDGNPTNLGVLDKDPENGVLEFSFDKKPQAFAITLEPEGGSKTPTLEQMVVMGEVQSKKG